MKNKKWSLEVKLLSGTGVNQVKLGALMGDFKEEEDDYFNESVRSLIDAGEVREYKENVVLKLGEFEGSTKEEAYGNYFESFDGDDQNELFFMNQVEAIELAVPCGCGGNCHTADNLDKLNGVGNIIESLSNPKFEVTNEQALSDAISRGELIVNEKVSVWKDVCYKIKEGATPESVVDDINSGKWVEWEYNAKDASSYIEGTEEPIGVAGTLEIYTSNGSKIGNN